MPAFNPDQLKAMVSRNSEAVSILLLLLIASIHLPGKINTPLCLLLLPLIFLYKNEVYATREFRIMFYFFCGYLCLFTLLSEDIPKSLVADFKVIKGIIFFLFSGIFFHFMKDVKSVLKHSFILLLFVLINFLFIKDHIIPNETYFSYYSHPNLAGFSLFFFIFLSSLLFFLSKTNLEKSINIVTILFSLILTVIANSRSIWIGLIFFSFVFIFLSDFITKKIKLSLILIITSSIYLLFFYFDNKDSFSSMSIRKILWSTLYERTMTKHSLTGFGFNTYKIYFSDMLSLANMPHNSVMEIFQSSGIFGILMMAALFCYLSFFLCKNFQRVGMRANSHLACLSCSAFFSLLVISLFDFRFFDFELMATLMVFLGLFNAIITGPPICPDQIPGSRSLKNT